MQSWNVLLFHAAGVACTNYLRKLRIGGRSKSYVLGLAGSKTMFTNYLLKCFSSSMVNLCWDTVSKHTVKSTLRTLERTGYFGFIVSLVSSHIWMGCNIPTSIPYTSQRLHACLDTLYTTTVDVNNEKRTISEGSEGTEGSFVFKVFINKNYCNVLNT